MDVGEAIRDRRSIRAYTKRVVTRSEVSNLLEIASRAPSGGNLQPWVVHVLGGTALEGLKRNMRQKLDSGFQEIADYQVYPQKLWAPYKERRHEAGALRYAALGSTDNDTRTRHEMLRSNLEFFGAPIGLFFFIDKRFGPPQWSDLGMYMQSLMLVARENGLDTCPQEVWSMWAPSVRDFLSVEDQFTLFAGMAVGYADHQQPINEITTSRSSVADFAKFHGEDF